MMSKATSVILLLCLATLVHSVGGEVLEEYYTKCRGQRTFHYQTSDLLRSPVDCLTTCTDRSDCNGVNVCPANRHSRQVSCQRNAGLQCGDCFNLTAAESPSCYYAQKRKEKKIYQTSVNLNTNGICENGGTPLADGRCDCHIGYGGMYCQRYIRDCSEMFKDGSVSNPQRNGPFGVYFIQPLSAPLPFPARCRFDNGGLTIPLRRKTSCRFPQSWTSCTAHFAGNIWLDSVGTNHFFIGLENLHHLTLQADYDLFIWMDYVGGGGDLYKYYNFKVGAEATSYEISYGSFSGKANGFSGSGPLRFSADGHDSNGDCYGQRAEAGWYDSNCKGYSPFSDVDNLLWPSSGGAGIAIEQMDFILKRTSPLVYDD